MKSLIKLFDTEDRIEAQQRATGNNINEMNLDYHGSVIPKIPVNDFFEEGSIYINKHHRYSYTPAHTHSFLEMNYILRGCCQQKINGDSWVLTEQQLIIMDTEVIQQIDYVGKNDLILNILINKHTLQSEILNHLPASNNPITDFFLNAVNTDSVHNTFLVFDLKEHSIIKQLLFLLIHKFYLKESLYQRSLNLLLGSCLLELAAIPSLNELTLTSQGNNLAPLLKYINDHYTTITLKKLATEFGYNQNYLGNMLKAKTGATFQEMIDQKRLIEAQRLLRESSMTIDTIAENLGYKSTPSLFKLFQNKMQMTPTQYRHFSKKGSEPISHE
jgi:AraC-like DNA-binding protein